MTKPAENSASLCELAPTARAGDWLIVLRMLGTDRHDARHVARALKRLHRIDGVKCIEARMIK